MSELAKNTIDRQILEINRLRAEVDVLERALTDYDNTLRRAMFQLAAANAKLGSIPRWVKGLYGIKQ